MDTVGNLMKIPCEGVYKVNKHGKLLVQKSDEELLIYDRKTQKLEKTLSGRGEMKYNYYVLGNSNGYFIVDTNFNKTATVGFVDVFVYGLKQFEEIGPGVFKKLIYNDKRQVRCQLLNHKGAIISNVDFLKVGKFNNGLAKVLVVNSFGEQKWGFINLNGQFVIEAKFSNEPTDFMGNRAFVEFKSGNYAMINEKGDFKTRDIYDHVESCSENRYYVVFDESREKYLIDSNALKIKKLDESKRYFTVEENQKSEVLNFRYYGSDGFMNFDGDEVVTNGTYYDIGPLVDNRAFFYQRHSRDNNIPEQKGYLNSKGEKVIVFSNGPGY